MTQFSTNTLRMPPDNSVPTPMAPNRLLTSLQSLMTTSCVGRASAIAAAPRPDFSEIASSPALMSQRSITTCEQESTSMPSPLSMVERMVRLRAVKFWQNSG